MKEDNKNTETEQCTIPVVRRSCSNCQFFQHEEVGDSDYGAIYSDVATCQKYLDTDPETEEDIPNFKRDIERDCCELDFWKVVDLDKDLSEKLSEDNGNIDGAYKLFCERYNYA
tara:strand:- start:385 stop:726 length:342 start_codon:yes stop_codon:yes gene_type:complete